MEQEFDKARILERVRKMMRLANDAAATDGERDNALRMAHATLAKYNLSMAQAEVSGEKGVEARTDGAFSLREYAWMRSVALSVAELFFCSFFFVPYKPKHANYCFVGSEANVFTAVEMAQYVIASINREATKQAVAAGETPRGTYWRDFCKGAMIRVSRRCKELIADAAKQKAEPSSSGTAAPGTAAPGTAAPGTAIVLASVYQQELKLNLAYIQETVGKLKTRASNQRRSTTAGFSEGYEFGGGIGLQKQVGG